MALCELRDESLLRCSKNNDNFVESITVQCHKPKNLVTVFVQMVLNYLEIMSLTFTVLTPYYLTHYIFNRTQFTVESLLIPKCSDAASTYKYKVAMSACLALVLLMLFTLLSLIVCLVIHRRRKISQRELSDVFST